MKRYLIPIIVVLVLASGIAVGCSSVPPSEPTPTQTPTTTELQTQVTALQEELNQLRAQEKAETLQQAEAYWAIVVFGSAGSSQPSGSSGTSESSGPTSIKPLTVEGIKQSLIASSQLWGLVKATEDPYLISTCQPNEWGQIPVSYSYIEDYAEGKYRELMSEYYSQQYIDDQLSMVEQPTEKTEEKVVTSNPEVEKITPKPEVDVTMVVEYEGKWLWQISQVYWVGRSGNQSKVFKNIRVPVEYTVQIDDEGTGPLVLKIIYEGQVVAEDTAIGQDDIAHVFWEGPQ